jgi:PhoH-like ATPase
MPLPKPPAKRAALLDPADFEAQAAPKPGKRPAKTRAASEPASPAVLDLFDGSTDAAPVIAKAPIVAAPAPVARPARPVPEPRPRKPRYEGPPRLLVLDTNVLMHDPMSLFRFEEHDVYLPMITLEELDNHKKGMTEVARNARQVSRDLDALAASMLQRDAEGITAGLPLGATGHREASGKLFFQTNLVNVSLPAGLPQGKADNQILGVVQALRD